MVGPVERLGVGWVLLPGEEPRLPRGDRRDAGYAVGLALVGDRVGRLGRGRNDHEVDLVGEDEAARHLGGRVRAGLGVLGDNLDRVHDAADHDLGGERRLEVAEDEVVRLAEAREGSGLGADVADLDRPAGRGRRDDGRAGAGGGPSGRGRGRGGARRTGATGCEEAADSHGDPAECGEAQEIPSIERPGQHGRLAIPIESVVGHWPTLLLLPPTHVSGPAADAGAPAAASQLLTWDAAVSR